MFRRTNLGRHTIVAALLALGASGVALADDSSMSMWTGDSYAFFNDLDYSTGRFNQARAPRGPTQDVVAKSPRKAPEKIEPRIMLAERPARITALSPFRDDTGA
jgi:hypothetical protein